MATDAETHASPPPPPPTGHHPTRTLVRYPDRGPLGGVCAGLAKHFQLDVTLVRIGAIVLACTGPGIPAYLLAWIFIPADDGSALVHLGSSPAPRRDRFSQLLGLGLIIVALSVLWGDWWWPGRGWMMPVALIAVGGWMLFRSHEDEDDHGVPGTPPPPPTSPSTWGAPHPTATSVAPAPAAPPAGATEAGSGSDATDQLPPIGPPPAPQARRRRVLGPLVFGALLLWGGVAWLGGLDVADGLAVGLCILGAGFVLGAFIGGSKVLILPALLVGLALVCVSVIDIPLHGGIGDRRWDISSIRELDDTYELAIGEATLDLSRLDVATGRVPEIEVDLGIGHLQVILPEGVSADVKVDVGAGDVKVLGYSDEGMGVEFQRSIRGDADGDRFELDLHVGLGEVEVLEAPR